MWGEVLRTTPQTYDLLAKPTPVAMNTTATKIAAYTSTKAIWSKKNMQGLGLIQTTVSGVIWQDYQTLGTAKVVLDALETAFGAAGGGIDLPPIGQHGKNSIHQFKGSVTTNPNIS